MRRALGFLAGVTVTIAVLVVALFVFVLLSGPLDLDTGSLGDHLGPWVFPLVLLGGVTGAWQSPLPARAWLTALGVLAGFASLASVANTLLELDPPRWLLLCAFFGWIPVCGVLGWLVGGVLDRRRRAEAAGPG